MEITLQYFDDCPNWRITRRELVGLLDRMGLDAVVTTVNVDTQAAAEELGFRGSPTVLIDGVDPFAEPDAPVGLACRIYLTESGPAGRPTLRQLERALTR